MPPVVVGRCCAFQDNDAGIEDRCSIAILETPTKSNDRDIQASPRPDAVERLLGSSAHDLFRNCLCQPWSILRMDPVEIKSQRQSLARLARGETEERSQGRISIDKVANDIPGEDTGVPRIRICEFDNNRALSALLYCSA